MRILLTGASGTVGYEVLKQLVALDQYELVVFDLKTKHSQALLNPFESKVQIIYGDLSDAELLNKACKNIDLTIHLAAIIPPLADEEHDLAHKVNVVGVNNLLYALEEYAPESYILYSSSVSVYGDRVNDPKIRVGDPLKPSPKDEYAVTKIAAEKLIQNSKLSWSIFRLTAIMGNHKMSKLMFHQPLNTSFEICTPADTARAFVLAASNLEALKGRVFNLGGGESCQTTYREFLNRSFDLAGLGKADFPAKAFAEKNFHCGFYDDGNKLEDILHYRKDSLENYYQMEKAKLNVFAFVGIRLFHKIIKRSLLKQSEPFQAFMKEDEEMMKHWFL